MAYAIRYRTSAKREFEQCCRDYQSLGEQLRLWVRQLVSNATPGSAKNSVDVFDVLDSLIADDLKDRWRHVRDKWKAAGNWEKTKAFLAWLKHHRPPWQLMSASQHFMFLGVCECEVRAYFEVDHVGKQVVFTKFVGLPGQDMVPDDAIDSD